MEHTKSKYLIWLETLHREYTDQTNITLFGKQAMLIKLLADMYEVKLRFKNVLAKLKNKTLIVLDDDDVNYKEWYDPNKWKINSTDLKDEDIVETLGVNNTEDISFSFANLLTDIFKNDISKINNDRFRGLVSTLFVFNTIVDEKIVKKALDNELIQLQEILVKIDTEKNKSKSPEEYADYFKKIKEDILNFMEKAKIKIEHQEWINGIIDVDMDDLKERRVKLLLDIFDSHFLDRYEFHKNADDPLEFENYDFDDWKGRLEEAKKDFAKLRKMCPYNDDMIDFSKEDKIGKYILVKKIPSNALSCFLKNMELIILVQEEMKALNAQNKVEEGDKDEPASELVRDKKIKQAILQIQKEKLFKKKYDYTWIMLFMKEVNKNKNNEDYKYKYLDLPTFNSSQSFVEYLKTLGLSDLPSDKSINGKQNCTNGSFPWTFTDKTDESVKKNRNKIVSRFISYYNTGK